MTASASTPGWTIWRQSERLACHLKKVVLLMMIGDFQNAVNFPSVPRLRPPLQVRLRKTRDAASFHLVVMVLGIYGNSNWLFADCVAVGVATRHSCLNNFRFIVRRRNLE